MAYSYKDTFLAYSIASFGLLASLSRDSVHMFFKRALPEIANHKLGTVKIVIKTQLFAIWARKNSSVASMVNLFGTT